MMTLTSEYDTIIEGNNILDTKQFKSVDRNIHKKYTRKKTYLIIIEDASKKMRENRIKDEKVKIKASEKKNIRNINNF